MSVRLFAALAVPDDIAERLLPLMRGVGGARWRVREQLHITLRFFGEVAEPVADDIDAGLAAAAESVAPFDLALKGAGHFGGEKPHALWIGVRPSPQLAALARRCDRAAHAAGLKADPQKYTPHLTVAYLGAGAPLDRVMAFVGRHGLFEAGPWRVERFGLFSSLIGADPAAQYRLEAEYPLYG
jgi:2'-5' RNA ligase